MMFLQYHPLGLLCYACLPGISDNLLGKTNFVVEILSPLISIKDQVGSYVHIVVNYASVIYIIVKIV